MQTKGPIQVEGERFYCCHCRCYCCDQLRPLFGILRLGCWNRARLSKRHREAAENGAVFAMDDGKTAAAVVVDIDAVFAIDCIAAAVVVAASRRKSGKTRWKAASRMKRETKTKVSCWTGRKDHE